MKKDIILQISNNSIQKVDYNKKGLIKSNFTFNRSIIDSIENFKVNMKKRNIFLLIEDEEIYIKYLRVPKIEKHDLNSIVKNRLKYLYGKKSEEIFYTYVICKEEENEMEVLVFCVNCDKLNTLVNSSSNYNINRITLIQLCFLNYYEKFIVDKDYLFIFKYNKSIYLLAVLDKKIVGNRIIEEAFISSISNDIEYVLHKSTSYNGNVKGIYSVNLSDNEISNCTISSNKYKAVNLGCISDEKIIEHFIINRR